MRRRVVSGVRSFVCRAGVPIAGCSHSAGSFSDKNEGSWYSKPVEIFAKPYWASSTIRQQRPTRPARAGRAEELVGADGRCGRLEAARRGAARLRRPSRRPTGRSARWPAISPARRCRLALWPPPIPRRPAGAAARRAQVMGGIALSMTECDVVRRAGLPGNVDIGAGDRGERQVVLTYLTGPWPGIYSFADGRLKVIDRAPVPPEPAKPPAKKKKPKSRQSRRPPATRPNATCSSRRGSRPSPTPRWRRAILLPPSQSPRRHWRGSWTARRRAPGRARTKRRRRASCRACASWRVSCAITASACEIRLRSGAVSARLSAAARRACTGSGARRRFWRRR